MLRSFLVFLLFSSIITKAQQPLIKLPSSPTEIVVDSKDNLVVHCYRGRILQIAPDGKSTSITDDIQKGLNQPPWPQCKVLAIDNADNLYFTDGNLIWKMTAGKPVLFLGIPYMARRTDGPATVACFRSIEYMKFCRDGSIYVVERDDTNKDNLGDYYVIRKISPDKIVSTLTDTRTNASLKTRWISGIGVDSVGNLYLSDGAGRCVKKMAKDGTITTMAGLCGKREFLPVYVQGDVSKAELMSPEDIVINKKGELVFADLRLNRIIKIAANKVATIAGNSVIQPNNVNMGGRSKEGYKDGKALLALFNFPLRVRITIDKKDNIYIIDGGNDCIRKLSADGIVTTIAKF